MGERRTVRRAPSFFLQSLGIVAVLLARGCSHDWDTYDPRLGGASSTTGGGHGGASAATTSSSSSASSSSASSSSGGGGASSSSSNSGGGASSSSASSSASSSSSGGMICMPAISQPCYDGAPGTENHSPCKPGVQICAPDGLSWGPCLTEVTPILEDCATAADDDCNGTPNEHCGLWSKRFGGIDEQNPYGMAVRPDGHLVITGQAFTAVDFGGGSLPAAGGGDLFIAEFDTTGAHVWSRVYGDASAQIGYGAAFDATGNVYVTGVFSGTLSFGVAPELTLVSAGLTDMFIVKLDPAGTPLWARSFGDPADQEGTAVAVDLVGNVYLGGDFHGTVDFGAGPKTAQSANGVVIKLDPTGAVLGSATFGASGDDGVSALAVDAGNNLLVTGTFATKAAFGVTTLTSQGGSDVFVAKLTAAGAPLWAHGYGSAVDETSGGIGVDSAGDVIFNGFFGGALDFGCGSVANVGTQDIFVTKLSPAGQCLWSHGYGNPTAGSKNPALTVDGAGNTVMTDEFVGTTDFGGGLVSTATPHDVLVLKLDPSGKYIFSRRFGNSGDQDGRAIGVDSAGSIYVLCELASSINFGNGNLSSLGGDDICLAKIAP